MTYKRLGDYIREVNVREPWDWSPVSLGPRDQTKEYKGQQIKGFYVLQVTLKHKDFNLQKNVF